MTFSLSSSVFFLYLMTPPPPRSTLFPYTTLFRSCPPSSVRSRAATSSSWRSSSGRRCSSERGAPRSEIGRSEEHTSELQSHSDLVCRLLLEKKKGDNTNIHTLYEDNI